MLHCNTGDWAATILNSFLIPCPKGRNSESVLDRDGNVSSPTLAQCPSMSLPPLFKVMGYAVTRIGEWFVQFSFR